MEGRWRRPGDSIGGPVGASSAPSTWARVPKREKETARSLIEGRRGDRRRPENHPSKDASGWPEDAAARRRDGRWRRPRAS